MTGVTELQRLKIISLELQKKELTQQLCCEYETNANLSKVLAYLTDGRFNSFAKENNWQRVIIDYAEGDDT